MKLIFHRIHKNGLHTEKAYDKYNILKWDTSSKAMSVYILPTSTNYT